MLLSVRSTETFALGRGISKKPSSTAPERCTVLPEKSFSGLYCTNICLPFVFTFTGCPLHTRFTASRRVRLLIRAETCRCSRSSVSMTMVYADWLCSIVRRASVKGVLRKSWLICACRDCVTISSRTIKWRLILHPPLLPQFQRRWCLAEWLAEDRRTY